MLLLGVSVAAIKAFSMLRESANASRDLRSSKLKELQDKIAGKHTLSTSGSAAKGGCTDPAFDCGTVKSTASTQWRESDARASGYRVCHSVDQPGLWECPAGHTKTAKAPFCKQALRRALRLQPAARRCSVVWGKAEPPIHTFLNGCFDDSKLAEGTSCNLTCLSCWKGAGAQPSCKGGKFEPGSFSCNFQKEECAKPSPTRGHRVCHDSSFKGKIPRVAFCMSGHARTMFLPKNYNSIRQNLLDAFGADTKVFGYLKWDDSSMIKVDPMDAGQQRKKPASVQVTRENLEPALKEMLFTNLTFANDPYPPKLNTKLNFYENGRYVNGRYQAPRATPWGQYAARSVAQLLSLRGCYSMVEQFERDTETRFDMVVRLRPDDFWMSAIPPYCAFDDLSKSSYMPMAGATTDVFFMLNREVANPVFALADTYYKRTGAVFTKIHGNIEAWIALIIETESNRTGYKVYEHFPFARALHRYNRSGMSNYFCKASPIETHICERMLYEDT